MVRTIDPNLRRHITREVVAGRGDCEGARCRRSGATVGAMRKLRVQQRVTVDTIAAEEERGLSFVPGEPFSTTDTSPFRASVMGFIDSVDTMILGANTDAESRDYWPHATEQGEYGEKVNNLTTIVASSWLRDTP